MTNPSIDIIAIGDAIVDVIATCDDAFIAAHGLPKGGMQLLDSDSAELLYAAMGNARETSGGSAANSMAGIAAMGGRAAFIGQINNDQLGDIFRHDMRALGVRFDTPSLTALDVMTSSRKANIPASTASGPNAICLLPSTPAIHTIPP